MSKPRVKCSVFLERALHLEAFAAAKQLGMTLSTFVAELVRERLAKKEK